MKCRQFNFNFNLQDKTHGGRRNNAGRKRTISRGCDHQKRERVSHRTPLHITLKFTHDGLKTKTILNLLKRAIQISQGVKFKIIHFSLQYNHLHLIAETNTNHDLTLGMRRLSISFAKNLNRLKKTEGKVLKERYHLHVLKTLREVKNAVHYVLNNTKKHLKITKNFIDFFSSKAHHEVVVEPKTWFLCGKFS